MTAPTAPGALPLLGHALAMARNPLGFLTSLPAAGDLVRIRLGLWKAFVVTDPDLVHHLLVNDRIFDKGGPTFDKAREVMGNGLVSCSHQDHRRQRRLLQPAFHRDRLTNYARMMSEQISVMIDSWQQGDVIDVRAQMQALTSRIVSRTLFVADVARPAAVALEESLDDIVRGVFRNLVVPPPFKNLPTPLNLRFRRSRARVAAAVDACVTEYRRSGVDHADVLSALLAARDDNGRALAESEIRDQVVTLLLGATETSATTLSWALHLLAAHPDVLEQVHAETDAVLGGRVAEAEDLPALELTNRVITETLRLYPPGWIFTRIVTADAELAGQPLPAGTIVIYSPYLIHRSPRLYPDPDRFDPDRWLPGHVARPPRTAYLPFAAGARRCIGDTFGLNQAVLTLASVAARWELRHTTRAVRAAPSAVLAPRSLRMRLSAR
ncbi:cytochrome P450 [Saccharopolyspora shandongensis]|uniref:cytochrome P450 n=1 Tax=Saccharopolyspora shandongensis TaxID=418495 RepID=UPI003444ED75